MSVRTFAKIAWALEVDWQRLHGDLVRLVAAFDRASGETGYDASPVVATATVDDSGRRIEVLVETRTAQAVVLKALRPVVLSADMPPFPLDMGPWAVLSGRGFEVDLKADPPTLKASRVASTVVV
ncbi:hypothetical protein [Streptomyces sp. CB01881]|uniref:hypothetical protein n=1 Tax=Streptomyces sp. CB01881 TaxID=2078691 RepID=UPI0013A5853C|nr:hypothetical protein [Streptomyces sp. CB01881]